MRDDIRTAILDSKPKSKIVEVFGIKVEIRQTAVGDLLSEGGEGEKIDRATAFAQLLVHACYVPGTNEKVFDETDIDGLKHIPFGPELTALQNAINELLGVDVQAERKN